MGERLVREVCGKGNLLMIVEVRVFVVNEVDEMVEMRLRDGGLVGYEEFL